MRLVRRNTTLFDYYAFSDQMTDLDDNGQHTGELTPVQSKPVTYRGVISSENGNTRNELFGTDTRYTHTLVMDDPNVDINELGTILWKGNWYEICAVRRSINTFGADLRRKTANNATQETVQEPVQEPEPEVVPVDDPAPEANDG